MKTPIFAFRKSAVIPLLLALAAGLACTPDARSAIGCTLNNPGRDLKTLYPDMTSYREELREIRRLPDGPAAFQWLQNRLRTDLDPVYEGPDTPYTLYSVFQQDRLLGYVHGVNVPGRGGVIQVFLAVDPETATIVRMFFQRLETPGGAALRDRTTREQFHGLTLADFYMHDYFSVSSPGHPSDKISRLSPPPRLPQESYSDWLATIRGVRKNLILLDLFLFNRRHDPFFERAQQLLNQKENQP